MRTSFLRLRLNFAVQSDIDIEYDDADCVLVDAVRYCIYADMFFALAVEFRYDDADCVLVNAHR